LNLIKSYDVCTPEAVGRNNQFLREYTAEVFTEDNLILTAKFLENNMDDALFNKCMETYNQFEASQQGGPLLFAIMMQHLMITNEYVSKALLTKLENLKLATFEGENVGTLVSHYRAILNRLSSMEKTLGGRHRHLIPNDLPIRIVKLLSQATHQDFAKAFEVVASTHFMDPKALWVGSYPDPKRDAEAILLKAETLYQQCVSANEWSCVTKKADETAFVAAIASAYVNAKGAGDKPCWNCGELGHTHQDCVKPKNADRIKATRNKIRSAQRQAKKGEKSKEKKGNDKNKKSEKWKPPGTGESNKRTIDGKPYYFHFKSKTWKLCDKNLPTKAASPSSDAPSTTAASNTAAAAPAGNTAAVAPPNLDVFKANLTKTFLEAINQIS
jgi:hypothetical protein